VADADRRPEDRSAPPRRARPPKLDSVRNLTLHRLMGDMTAQAIIVMLGVAAAVAAVAFETWLWMRKPAARWPLSYAAWTIVAVLLIAGSSWSDGAGAALFSAVLFGPILYPLIVGVAWLRWSGRDYAKDEREAELARLEPHATDFGGMATQKPAADPAAARRASAAALTAAMTVAPARSALGRISSPLRPRWHGPAEMMVVCLGSLLLAAAWIGAIFLPSGRGAGSEREAHPADLEAVAATLEMNGYAAPRVQAYGALDSCSGYVYRWRAIGADGRACVHADGYVSPWVERRWPATPPAGATAAPPRQAHELGPRPDDGR
jgi:hypothetical protein